MKDLCKRYWADAAVILGFLVIALVYFFTPLSQGYVLGGHDTVAGMGQGHEQEAFREATGEVTRWTGSLFSGMPTYQISPSYGPTQLLGKIGWVIGLFTTGPMNYVFLYLFGFYILMRSFRLRPLISALGSILWAFSSYFFIIIAAGHIWKVNTLGFIPPTIAGMVIAYNAWRTDGPRWMQGNSGYLLGGLVTALFTGLQVLSNHIQMTYYFLFLMAFITIAYGVEAFLQTRRAASSLPDGEGRGGASSWLKATLAIVLGGLLGAAVNLPNLYHTWEYSHESMRGPSELTAATNPLPNGEGRGGAGLDPAYITAWSYGIDETMTLMIPMYKGGGSTSIYDREDAQQLEGFDSFNEHCAAVYQAFQGQIGYLPGTSQYWGDQPMTVGPVYVGAIVCFLFILGLFVVRGPMKWALVAATLVSLLFAWGKNIMPLTEFFIDHLPMYNKFRTVSSALVVAEFTMPLLGVLALAEVLKDRTVLLGTLRGKVGLAVSLVTTLGSCLLFAAAPGMADCISGQDMTMLEQLKQAGVPFDFCESYRAAIIAMHESILSASALRSAGLIAVAAVLIIAYVKRPQNVPAPCVVAVLLVVSLADMWDINRNYLNEKNFQSEGVRLSGFSKTPADETILADGDPDCRVLNLATSNPFNESDNRTAYWHKSIGGYHAAKLHRYQDLIDRYLNREVSQVAQALTDSSYIYSARVSPVLNMLNMKWVKVSDEAAVQNPHAQGNAWFIDHLSYVPDANAEISALKDLDLTREAVADQRFQDALGAATSESGSSADVSSEASHSLPNGEGRGGASLTTYAPNELHYTVESEQGGVVAFSEVYYPGWSATVDGERVEVGRVNYILRAIRVPAGKHEVVLAFRPATLTVTNAIAYASLTLLLLGFAALVFLTCRRTWKK